MNQQAKGFIIIFLFLPIWFLVYAFFHEAAHALLHIAYGGTIESFVFVSLTPHVRASGTEFTPFAAALNRVSGELLTRTLGAIAIAFYSAKVKSPAYHVCYFMGILSMTGGVIVAWIFIPISSVFTVLQTGDDILIFLDMTGFHPIIFALAALFLISAFVLFAHGKGIFENAWLAYKFLAKKSDDDKRAKPRSKFGIAVLGLLLAAMLVFTAAFFVPYEPRSLLNISASVADVREERQTEYTFTAGTARLHQFSLDIQAQGFVTGFIVQDYEGNRYFSWAVEQTTSTFGLGLSEGVYTVRFIFLTDFESVTDFLKEIEAYEHMDSYDMQNFREIFDNNTDFSIVYSLRVR